MTDTERKPVQLFIDQLNVAYSRNLILSLSVNIPYVTITFHKETNLRTIDRIIETMRKNYQSIQKVRVECHQYPNSHAYHYVLNVTLA